MAALAIIGCGWLGTAIANAYRGELVATTRSGARPPELQPRIPVVGFDVLGATALPQPLAQARAWVVAIAPGPTQDRRALYVEGARRLGRWLPALARLVWLGSTSALPDVDGELGEDCFAWPDDDRGRVQREAETVIDAACADAGVPLSLLRLGGLYGPGRELARLYLRGEAPAAPLPGDGMTATNLVHRDDAVAAVHAAIELPRERSGVIHVVDGDHTPRREMLARACAAAGLPAPQWSAPAGPLRGKQVRSDRLGPWLGVVPRPRPGA
ncbi:MAG: hypothetical protein K1X88_07125 [Nannocystaceae bacterium]|nr:hypothetical protein [Nannocystaceae bacterium]